MEQTVSDEQMQGLQRVPQPCEALWGGRDSGSACIRKGFALTAPNRNARPGRAGQFPLETLQRFRALDRDDGWCQHPVDASSVSECASCCWWQQSETGSFSAPRAKCHGVVVREGSSTSCVRCPARPQTRRGRCRVRRSGQPGPRGPSASQVAVCHAHFLPRCLRER